jgi:glutaredoxin
MTRICPKCAYVRKPTDEAPDWQCPSCQIAYVKAHGEPARADYGRYGTPLVRNKPAASNTWKWLLLAVLLGAGAMLGKPLWSARQAPQQIVASTAQPAVTLYATAWCGYCAATRELFERNGIQYTELDIEKSSAGYEGHKRLGGRGVPLIVIGDEVIHGYDEPTLRARLKPWFKSTKGDA